MNRSAATTIVLHTDGASRGNPGQAAAGFIATCNEHEILRGSKYLGLKTNNEAEYLALQLALSELLAAGQAHAHLEVRADSELMIRQLQGKYKVKAPGLRTIFAETKALLQKFASHRFVHVTREQNREADRLANQALDEHVAL